MNVSGSEEELEVDCRFGLGGCGFGCGGCVQGCDGASDVLQIYCMMT